MNVQQSVCGLRQSSREKLAALKIPEKPKKPLSSYFQYLFEHLKVMKAKHPDWAAKDVMKKCAENWRSIDATAKQKYEIAARENLEEYAKKHLTYMAGLTDEQKTALQEVERNERELRSKMRLKRKAKELNKPKRPVTAYVLYALEQKAKDKNDKPLMEYLRSQNGRWRTLSDAEKAKYVSMAEANWKAYNIELKAWEKSMIKEGNYDVVRRNTLEEEQLTQPPRSKLKSKRENKKTVGQVKKSE